MVTTMSSTLTLLVSLIFISSSCSFVHAKTSNSTGFSTNLIHMDSVRSPFYNPNLTRTDRIQASVRRSYARQHHIQAMISNKVSPSDFTTLILPERGEYLMEYYIGTPPVRTYGIIDTGSTVVWLQCLPCRKCYNQTIPLFDTQKSTSYKPLYCEYSSDCPKGVGLSCNTIYNKCQYSYSYEDGSYSEGFFAYEMIHFTDINRKISKDSFLRGLVGCGDNNHDEVFHTNTPPGIIGLSMSGLSFAGQLRNGGFAYCLGEPDDPHEDGYIKFGKEAISTKTNWIEIKNTGGRFNTYYYIVDLYGISVGQKRLPIPENTFKYNPTIAMGGFIIDSGTSYSTLETTAFKMLTDELDLQLHKTHFDNGVFPVCYDTAGYDFTLAPTITFHFQGVDLKLPTGSTWELDYKERHCLAMLPTDSVFIFGNHQQKKTEITFDLFKSRISLTSKESCYLG
ncbi:hypothetical protein AQUCO_03700153v1 [Aquilegia coerulea]|uniref:Peptidase A1 domain-containing protein n=1 Tax=Aquilegia coerulea TaxID=218851 RepID=A0A2G5CTR1_AQUCA|nr:hypothetical protein AQUCO_03700153v1 [Aquilegia coerulea]